MPLRNFVPHVVVLVTLIILTGCGEAGSTGTATSSVAVAPTVEQLVSNGLLVGDLDKCAEGSRVKFVSMPPKIQGTLIGTVIYAFASNEKSPVLEVAVLMEEANAESIEDGQAWLERAVIAFGGDQSKNNVRAWAKKAVPMVGTCEDFGPVRVRIAKKTTVTTVYSLTRP